jgi:hypothetical protein
MAIGSLERLMLLFKIIIAELRAFFTRPSWLSEVASGITTCLWGIFALNSNSDIANWPSLDLFVRVADSSVWGVLAILIGVGQMLMFRVFDHSWAVPWCRLTGAVLASWMWGAVTLSAAQFVPFPPGISAYIGWWFINLYLMVRLCWTRG